MANEHLFGLNGKVALVTGTSRGLGAGMARALAAAGDIAVSIAMRPVYRGIPESEGARTACFAADPPTVRLRTVSSPTRSTEWVGSTSSPTTPIIRRHPAATHTDDDGTPSSS
jgi:hypothetical protein